MNKLYNKIKQKGITIGHVCEVGVYLPDTSNILEFINDDIRTTLVEPDDRSIRQINEKFRLRTNITLYPVAIYDYYGQLDLVQRDASSYVSTIENSPAVINDNYIPVDSDKISVSCTTMDKVDDGTIELLSVDTEGSEWYALKNLKSRPKIISVETHGRAYKNPFFSEIMEWMKKNNYITWYKGKTDTVFIIKGLFKISVTEKVGQFFMDFYLRYRRLKYNSKDRN